ncbi:carboxypeptidase S [Hortaea werneckii]|nr:carboxypeptidase S [Hortaea werneckii]
MTARHTDGDVHVRIAFLAYTWHRKPLPHLRHPSPLIHNRRNPITTIPLQQKLRQLPRPLGPTNLLIETKAKNNTPPRLKPGLKQTLQDLHLGDQLILTIDGTPAPDELPVVEPAKRRMCPGIDCRSRNGHDVLVRHENQGLQIRIAALPCVHQSKCIHLLDLQGLVHVWESVGEVLVEVEAGVPSLVFAHRTHVVEGFGGDLDGARVAFDRGLFEVVGGEEVVRLVEGVVVGGGEEGGGLGAFGFVGVDIVVSRRGVRRLRDDADTSNRWAGCKSSQKESERQLILDQLSAATMIHYDLRPPNPMKCMSWVGRPATAKLAGGPALAELPPKHVIPAKTSVSDSRLNNAPTSYARLKYVSADTKMPTKRQCRLRRCVLSGSTYVAPSRCPSFVVVRCSLLNNACCFLLATACSLPVAR